MFDVGKARWLTQNAASCLTSLGTGILCHLNLRFLSASASFRRCSVLEPFTHQLATSNRLNSLKSNRKEASAGVAGIMDDGGSKIL